MSHLLIVDDDERLRELLKRYLERNGHQVTGADSAESARRLLQNLTFDLMVLDVMMPGQNGYELASSLDASRPPIIMLTARSALSDRLAGFEAGVDDYLTKPFEPQELLYRIDAIMRRMPKQNDQNGSARFGEYRFDFNNGQLYKGENRIHLTRTERDVLSLLASQMSQTISREALLNALDEPTVSNPRAVDVIITRIRKKIEIDPKNPSFLQTSRGKGYVLQNPQIGAK